MNVSTPSAGENSKYTEGKKFSNYFGDSQLRRNGIFNFIISRFYVDKPLQVPIKLTGWLAFHII